MLADHIHRAGYDYVDCIEPIGWTNERFQREYAERLLLQRVAILPSGRREILVCSICADLACGCVSADIVIDQDSVVWRDVGIENNYDANQLTLFRMGSIRFAKSEYQHAIRAVVPVDHPDAAQQ